MLIFRFIFILLLPVFIFGSKDSSTFADCSCNLYWITTTHEYKDITQVIPQLSDYTCNSNQQRTSIVKTITEDLGNGYAHYSFEYTTQYCQSCIDGKEYVPQKSICDFPCTGDQVRDDNGDCVSPPLVCYPDKINYNGVCTSCPAHSHPKDETTCECDDSYKYSDVTHSCVQCVPPDYFNTFTSSCDTSDCQEPYIPAPDYSTTFKCILPPDNNGTPPPDGNGTGGGDGDGGGDGGGDGDGSKCEHPPFLYGSPFQGIMTNAECLFDHSGWTFSCPDDSVACYYSDNNDTGGGDGGGDGDDGNGTGGGTDDGNGTGGSLAGVESRLDTVIDYLSAAGAIHTSIGDLSNSINNNGKNLGDKLDKIDFDLNNRLAGVNENLGSKLDDLKSAIQDKNLSLDMSESNQYLKDIKDKMYEDHDSDIDDLNTGWDELSTSVDNALASYTTMFDSLGSIIGNTPTPVITAGGSPCPMNVFLYGQDVDFAEGFNLFLTYLKPIMLLILNLSLTYTLIVLSVRAYADITNRVSNIFRS